MPIIKMTLQFSDDNPMLGVFREGNTFPKTIPKDIRDVGFCINTLYADVFKRFLEDLAKYKENK